MILLNTQLKNIKVISFDLDDTLYDNSEVIRLAEQECVGFLAKSAQLTNFNLEQWHQWKKRIFQQDPIFCENVTAWREQTIRELLTTEGKSAVEIEQISAATMQHFIDYRHRIDVPPQSIEILNQLKQQFSLSVITNGNVTPSKIGFNQFELVLCGGVQGRAKPHKDLFAQTAAHFNVELSEILHVGDNLITDVHGAIQAGCQAVWLNLSEQSFEDFEEKGELPTVEINDLVDLLRLLE
ncbi:MAG: HAD-IA family hydrolase [Lonepinella koalarum]|nr:HAD-IA family hydrolase [Lonepinella koalarum]